MLKVMKGKYRRISQRRRPCASKLVQVEDGRASNRI